MADDLATIEARLRTEYPTLTARVDKQDVPLDQGAYDARIAEMAVAERQAQLDAEADAARKELRRQVRVARTRLQQIATAVPPFSNAQRDAAIQDTANYLDRLIGILIDANLIEASD